MRILAALFSLITLTLGFAQAMFTESAPQPKEMLPSDSLVIDLSLDSILPQRPFVVDTLTNDTIWLPRYESVTDSLFAEALVTDTVISFNRIPRKALLPAVFTEYTYPDTTPVFTSDYSGKPYMRWAEDALASQKQTQRMLQWLFVNHPEMIDYNIATLPEAPKEFIAVVNPDDHTISIKEFTINQINDVKIQSDDIKKRHWVKNFNASLQFSQAFVSPNWYQGGNNNVNALLNLYYNVKLNQAFHPNLLFDNTFQYKLGINSAPDDTIRNYNVSEDIFQINTVFGIKAVKKWYYSVTGQFKTQLVNSYNSNTNNLRSAFLAPADLNIGLGMTYNTANAKKTFTFDASISPLSYNMKICRDDRIKVAGIDEGKKFAHNFGSSGEAKMFWRIAYNITLNSRIFGFTDYKRAYADWENTMVFEINKFLTTQLFWYMRYDTHTPKVNDNRWKKLQVKEIFSLGFSYKFSSI